jgi:hypothetical protein
MENLSTGNRNSDDSKGSDSKWKEVTEVDILWKAYETYLDNIIPLAGELPDWLRFEAGTKKSDISQSLVPKLSKRQLVF